MKTLQIKVKPQSRVQALTEQDDGTWLAQIKAQPIDGKANAALIKLIAQHFDVRAVQVSIKTGASARLKLVCIDD
jgi:uncharacterized protein